MDPLAQNRFTISQLGFKLGISYQAVWKHLACVAGAGETRASNGNKAATYAFSDLPAPLVTKTASLADGQGFRNAETFLASPLARWEPQDREGRALAPADIHAGDSLYSRRLQAALAPALARQHDQDLSRAEFHSLALAGYAKAFGHRIGERQSKRLLEMVLERDRGAEDFGRLEIFLPPKPRRKPAGAQLISSALRDSCPMIESVLRQCRDITDLSKEETLAVWTAAMDQHTALTRAGIASRKAGKQVREFLWQRVASLAPSREALKKSFNRRLAEWRASQGDVAILRDGRENNTGNFDDYEVPEADAHLLIGTAIFIHRDGCLPNAWRTVMAGTQLSEATRTRYAESVKGSKSYVPRKIKEAVGADIENLYIISQGKRYWDQAKGYVSRSYDGIRSLQCMQADDFTLPVYWWINDQFCRPKAVRGQCLFFMDFRSLKILGWSLQPDPNYNSVVIRSELTHLMGAYAVPEMFYFERGIWRDSLIISGGRKAEFAPLSGAEIKMGLRALGSDFIFAIRPRSKTIERVGGLLQDRMEGEPGYCGRDERRDCPERTREALDAVNRTGNPVHPSKYFYEFRQWNERLAEIVDGYNASPQQGRILAGLSPDAAFEKYLDPTNPPMQFDARVRYLLAHDRRPVDVTRNGIVFRIGKTAYHYAGRELDDNRCVGARVLAWFNPESPEVITVTDLAMRPESAFTVNRLPEPNALECLIAPGSGTLGRALAQVEGTVHHFKPLYNVVKSKCEIPKRFVSADRSTEDLGRKFAAAEMARKEEGNAKRRKATLCRRVQAQVGDGVDAEAFAGLPEELQRDYLAIVEGKS